MVACKRDNHRSLVYPRLAVSVYALFLIVLNTIRIFDNNFWGDEAFTIRLSKMNFIDMLVATAEDVHPPLYYLIVQIVCRILGYTGEVYHFASLLPYLLVVIVAMTCIWKRFGMEASVLLITMTSILETAVAYNVEVRMYSWGSLFMLLSFLALYDILTENSKKSYILFTLFSLAGAYTHYYCLVSVAFFYLALIGLALVKRQEYFKKVLTVCIATVVLYLPWFIVLLITFKRTMGDFWMTGIPYIKDCIAFFFQGSLQYVLFAAMLLAVGVAVWYQRRDTRKVLWFVAGLSSIFGTILVGNIMSRVFRPVFIVRYLYPVTIIAWVLLAVGIAACKKKRIFASILTIAILAVGVPAYIENYRADVAQSELLTETLAVTEEAVGEGNVILTDMQIIEWTIADYYYPETEHYLLEGETIPVLDADKEYWLMLQAPISEELKLQLINQEYSSTTVIEGGTLGTLSVNIYKMEKN